MTLSFRRSIVLFVLVIAFGSSIVGVADTQSDNDWHKAARKCGLAEQDVKHLREHGILVTNVAYEQVFSAYISSNMPLFITSDSLLNAYHVLYEESIRRLEARCATRLPEILRFILNNLTSADEHVTGKPELVANAKKRAQIVIGVALRLLDEELTFTDKDLNSVVENEVNKVIEAKAVEKPSWLGKSDEGFLALDYSRYKPRGSYTSLPLLERYFRSLSWLQSIPFRVGKDEEFLAILMLGNCVTHKRFEKSEELRQYEAFFTRYRMFIGAGDDWDIMTAARQAQLYAGMNLDKDDLERIRRHLIRSTKALGGGPAINDQMRYPPMDPNQVTEPNFRIFSAYRTPSAVLFQRTTDLRRFQQPPRLFPDGLEVCIAIGSSKARDLLKYEDKDKLLATIEKTKSVFRGKSLYFSYLSALSALLDEPESDAPNFMRGDAWRIKCCNTVLGGWAQLRHTWILQAKQSAFYGGRFMLPPGFVEPEPEFFYRMADLAEKTLRVLDESEALGPDYTCLVPHLVKLEELLEGVNTVGDFEGKLSRQMPYYSLGQWLFLRLADALPAETQRGSAEYYAEKRQQIRQLLEVLRNSGVAGFRRVMNGYGFDLQSLWADLISSQYEFDLQSSWTNLSRICSRLGEISQKQLRGIALNSSEESFIKSYGARIARIML